MKAWHLESGPSGGERLLNDKIRRGGDKEAPKSVVRKILPILWNCRAIAFCPVHRKSPRWGSGLRVRNLTGPAWLSRWNNCVGSKRKGNRPGVRHSFSRRLTA